MPSLSIREQLASAIRTGKLRVPDPKPKPRTDFVSKVRFGKPWSASTIASMVRAQPKKSACTVKPKAQTTKLKTRSAKLTHSLKPVKEQQLLDKKVEKEKSLLRMQYGHLFYYNNKQYPRIDRHFFDNDIVPFKSIRIEFDTRNEANRWYKEGSIFVGRSFYEPKHKHYITENPPYLEENAVEYVLDPHWVRKGYGFSVYWGTFIGRKEGSGDPIFCEVSIRKDIVTPTGVVYGKGRGVKASEVKAEQEKRENLGKTTQEKAPIIGFEARARARASYAVALAGLGRESCWTARSLSSDGREAHLIYTPMGGSPGWKLGKGHI